MSVLRYLGMAGETSYNPDTPPEAVVHVDIASAALDAPSDTEIIYAGGLTRTPRLKRPGFYAPSGNVVYAADIATLSWLFKCVLGGYKFTAGALNTHECWGSNETYLPSFTARLGRDLFEHVFAGCVLSTLDLVVEGGLAMATLGITAARDLKDTLQNIEDLLLPTQYPLAFHEFRAYLVGEGPGGVDVEISAKVRQFTLAINNGLATDVGRTIGSRHPRRLPVQEREVRFSATLEFEDLNHLERLWGGANGPVSGGSTEFGLRIVGSVGVDGDIDILIPRLFWTQVQQPVSGRTLVSQTVTGRALLATVTLEDTVTELDTDVLVTITNDQAPPWANLTSLTENLTASFVPAFVPATHAYALAAGNLETSVILTATRTDATIKYSYGAIVNKVVASGVGEVVPLAVGANVITIDVELPWHQSVQYTITATRAAE